MTAHRVPNRGLAKLAAGVHPLGPIPTPSPVYSPLAPRSVIIAALITLAGCATGAAQATSKLDPAACRAPRSGETARLPRTWDAFRPYVKVCDVADGRGKIPLTLATVSAADFYRKQPDGAPTVELPKPILFDASGDSVGSLPYSFPDDPPFELQVTFAGWRAGWPERVELFLNDPTVSGDRALDPLVWNGAARRYVVRAGQSH